MLWFAYFKRSLFSKIWIAVVIASAVLAVIRNISQTGMAFSDRIPAILLGILGGIVFTLVLDVVFSLLYATTYTVIDTQHNKK
ncbi:MAG TPA: hypothetical protein O0X27_05445 [Methanocorpusculum sp.]|nr:hypothetical protein [Methanocorpusculum sp.]